MRFFEPNYKLIARFCPIDVSFEGDVILEINYYLEKKFLWWWFHVTHKDYDKDGDQYYFNSEEDAINYIIRKHKGDTVNLIRENTDRDYRR